MQKCFQKECFNIYEGMADLEKALDLEERNLRRAKLRVELKFQSVEIQALVAVWVQIPLPSFAL